MSDNQHAIKNLILDMDGVLWRGETPVPGLQDFFETAQRLGLGFVLATNNATKTAVQYTKKLARFGIDLPADRILNSAEATAHYLRQHYPAGARAYVIGESGLQMAMAAQEFNLLPTEEFVGAEARAELVVVGFNRHVCYVQLASAVLLIHHGARFVGTNPDLTYPSEYGPLPGAGSTLAYIQAATGITPTIIGKPNKIIFEEALQRLGGTPDDTVMVGDRLNTDIAGGQTAGLRTILLLSGISSQADAAQSEWQPTWILDDLIDLTRALENGRLNN